ncbi:MAG: hypothetical protein HDS96_00265 [Bacteroidales bacterium]|nr:hypothetical protein [Bacteroidales bacterium]
MKRLYSIMLSAAVAVAASAAIPVSKAPVKGQLSDLQKTGRIITESVASHSATRHSAFQPRKAASRSVTAPQSIEDLCNMEWEASYVGMLQNNSGAHSGTAKFTYYPEYDELDLTLPDYTTDLYVGFEEETGSLLIYSSVGYGQNSQGIDIKLQPINTSGTPVSSGFRIPFNEEIGGFEFPSTFAWGLLAYSGNSMAGYFWAGAQFTLNVAGAVDTSDYSVSAAISGSEVSADNTWTINVEQGADVASVKCLVLPYDADPADYASYIAALGDEVTNGSITINPVSSNVLNEPITQSDYACAIFASYDADGKLKKTAHVALPVIIDDEQEGWATVGTVSYTDGIFAQYYEEFEYTKEDVLVQAKTDNSPVYRLVSPYSDLPIFDLAGHTHSLVIDATHSDWVAIPTTFSGLDLAGDGTLAFGSIAALGYDYATAMNYGYAGGTIEDNVVTFPKGTLFAYEQYYNKPAIWNSVNSTNSSKAQPVDITLPAITLNIAAVKEDETPNAGVEIKFAGSDEVLATTDENGTATIEVPFTTGYFGEIALTIGGQDVTVTLNGAENEYTHKAGEPVVGEWKSLGEGTWVDGFFTDWYVLFEGVNNSWTVNIEENTTTPGLYRVLPYASETEGAENLDDADDSNYFLVNATDPEKVFIEGPFTPFGDYDLRQNCAESCEDYDGEGTYGKFVDGEIFFPARSFTEYYEGEAYDPTNTEGILMIVLPGHEVKDYQLVTASSLCGDNGKATINFETVGSGIASIQTTTVAGHYIFADDVEGEPVNVDLSVAEAISHTVNNPVGGNTTLVEALDANGNVRRAKTVYHFNNFDFIGWHYVKEAKVTESCLFPAFGYEDAEITCNFEEKDDEPGMYRIANVYREHDYSLGHLMHNHYLYIDATDPDYVKVIPSNTGVGDDDMGEIYITNDAEYYEQSGYGELAKEFGTCGTMNDNIIDLGEIFVAFSKVYNGAWNEGYGTITIELVDDGKDGISEISSDSEADAVYYNIRGQRVARPTVPGIYVRNNTKVYVK